MKSSRNVVRKGFTLVELLIVIVLVGMLSAMMMISSSDSVTSAQRAEIVGNLRTMRVGALAMYAENPKKYDTDPPSKEDLARYMGLAYIDEGYNIVVGTGDDKMGKKWYVTYGPISYTDERTLVDKLAAVAKKAGLYGCGNEAKQMYPNQYGSLAGTTEYVGMWVR